MAGFTVKVVADVVSFSSEKKTFSKDGVTRDYVSQVLQVVVCDPPAICTFRPSRDFTIPPSVSAGQRVALVVTGFETVKDISSGYVSAVEPVKK